MAATARRRPAVSGQGSGHTHPGDNAFTVFLAVTCNDIDWPEDVATYRHAVAQDRKRFPLFGAAAANILPCAYWKHEPAEAPVRINDKGPRNVLICRTGTTQSPRSRAADCCAKNSTSVPGW